MVVPDWESGDSEQAAAAAAAREGQSTRARAWGVTQNVATRTKKLAIIV